jgi:drug/metabolite transporter (DMT)-like permease
MLKGRVQSSTTRGAVLGLLAAASFGVSAPLAKLLLGSVSPTLLAGLLYTGAALALWSLRVVRPATHEVKLRRSDLPRMAAVVAFGGIAAPVLMLHGLSRVSAFSGSLLLNLEAPFTMLLAVLLFGEHLGRRAALSAVAILIGAALLELEPGALRADTTGMLALAAACGCWALDNNLTQRLSLRDPFAVVRVKATASGLVNTLLGLIWLDVPLPTAGVLGAALALGSVSYGASVVLDAYALRHLGAAREAAYFATAPFLGALLSFALFERAPSTLDGLALASMLLGVVLLLGERHAHRHVHAPMQHEHLHTHDEHHQHAHAPGDPAGEPHAHWHHHTRLEHAHEHAPDLHHRHSHG